MTPSRHSFQKSSTVLLRFFPRRSRQQSDSLRNNSVERIFRNHNRSSYSTSAAPSTGLGRAGAGIGNVHDQMLPTTSTSEMRFKHINTPKTASIIGAPMTYGQPYVGTDHGPGILRRAGILKHLSTLGWRVNDMSDINFDKLANDIYQGDNPEEFPNAKNSKIVGKGCEMLAKVVESEISKGRFPVILGGDHSIAAGSLAGILRSRPETGVIWVDAHADLNTPETSESGNMHGMPVGLLLEDLVKDYSSIPGFEWLDPALNDTAYPRLNSDSIVYVGLRDVDTAERQIIQERNIKVFTMHDIDHFGIGKVMDLALAHLLENNSERPIHLSYDIDAVDPVHAPATGTAVRGGLTYREAHFVAEAVAKSGSLASVEMVELNPKLSDNEGGQETVELGLGLLTSLLGKSII